MKKILLLLLILAGSFSLYAKDVPHLSSPVIDEVGWVHPTVKNALINSIKRYYQDHKIQLQVYITNSLEGEPIENFSIKAVDQWKLGKADTDKGILLLVSAQDRKMRIEVGQGLEGDLPDISAGRIIERMKPFFKHGDYQDGILLGLKLITLSVGPQLDIYSDKKIIRNKKRRNGASVLLTIFIIIGVFGRFFGPLVLFSGGRFGGYGVRHRGSSGGFGGFSSGSSGWSGGGGGFSGGGASGSW